MPFRPLQKLAVTRTLSTGERVAVGVLAQNRQGVFFQYQADYLAQFGNLSPFTLQADTQLQPAPKQPHQGLHGVFADCLPDGWGLLLQDRLLRQQGILPTQVTAMDRLALVGESAMGALSFTPASELTISATEDGSLATIGLAAQTLFDQVIVGSAQTQGISQQLLARLLAVGSSGGARPKAQIYLPATDATQCHLRAEPGDEAWLVKFTSSHLALGHEEGLCEAVYLQMAAQAGCQPPSWKLLAAPTGSGASAWLAVKRFDRVTPGRLHMHSACGLLDADFRSPSLDYIDLIKASRQLCKSPAAGQLQFRRAIFNLFAANQDDHSKNWAFLQTDDGQWQPAPFYDVTFSPHAFNEHATAFGGYGKSVPLKTMQKLAASAGFASWKEAQHCIQEVVEALAQFAALAKQQEVSAVTQAMIEQVLAQQRAENASLMRR